MKHIWIKSLIIDDKGNYSNEMLVVLSPSLETKHLKLKPTNDKTVNDAFIKVSFTNQKARAFFYKNPISVGDKKYVMYKRSASSSRQGNVLFIRDDLFEKMDDWSNCGIDLTNPENREKVSKNFLAFQAYKALTLSGCENFIHLNPKNILVIDDLYSTFSALALSVSDKEPTTEVYNLLDIDKKIFAYESFDNKIKNCIWDGQGFLDNSVFENPEIDNRNDVNHYQNNSMMILRNRFFKSCVFRTRLQEWFRHNGLVGEIEKDSSGMPIHLNGYTEATTYEEIKMVVTYSSLKYIKFFDNPITAIKKWMSTVKDLFGIVKTDKPTPYFGGKYVRTNYQLLNTIYLTEENALRFLEQNKKMIEKVGTNSKAFMTYVECCSGRVDDITEEKEIDGDKLFDSPFEENDDYFDPRLEVCRQLVKLNSKFDNTSFYRVFIRKYLKQLSKNIEIGKVLIQGTYATIVSNPFEMLKYIVKQYNILPGEQGEPLMRGELYSTFFGDGVDILGSRSPHILPGNILVTENKHNYEIDEYFVFNSQIVCINSIGSLILHRLNGSDQDGDTILLTNNEILVNEAKRFNNRLYMKFTVPVNCISEAEKTDYIKRGKIDTARFAKADHKLSNNLIGAIVNLSQKYNSILWDTFVRKYHDDSRQMHKLHKLYYLNSILEVLSNNEIDAAKGKTDFDASCVLKELEKMANEYHHNDPLFFVGIEEKKKQREIDKKPEAKGKLAIGDDSTTKIIWFERTTSNLDALTLNDDLWVYKPDKKSFKRNKDTKDLDVGDAITLLFVCKKHPNSVSYRSILIADESVLEDFGDRLIRFNNVKEAFEYKNYSENELYLIKGNIHAFARFKYDKYETTMDYVYENAGVKSPGGQGRAYTKLSDCYKSTEGIAPKNNCEEITNAFIRRLIFAEKVRQILLKSDKSGEDLEVLKMAKLNETRNFTDYKEFLYGCANFDGDSFFSSKDRIKSLIRTIDGTEDDDIRKAFYLALYLMFNDPKTKYKDIFEADIDRHFIMPEDIEELLFGC